MSCPAGERPALKSPGYGATPRERGWEGLPVGALYLDVVKSWCLEEAGFRTVGDLAGARDEELAAVRGIGPGTVRLIRERIEGLTAEAVTTNGAAMDAEEVNGG